MKNTFYILLLIFPFHLLFAQQYIPNVAYFNIDNGLSHNHISWIHKDNQGMVWIGTVNGINRFDGQNFKYVAKANFKDYPRYPIVPEDASGDLWLWRDPQSPELFFFNTITEKIKTFEEKFGPDPPFKKNDFSSAIILSNETTVVATRSGQLVFLNNKNQVTAQQDFQQEGIQIFNNSNSNNFWIHKEGEGYAQPGQLLLSDEKGNQRIVADSSSYTFNYFNVTKENHLLFGTFQGGILVNELSPDGKVKHYDFNYYGTDRLWPNKFRDFNYDKKLNRLISCYKGQISIVDLKDNRPPFTSEYFKELDVTEIYCSMTEGDNYWVGTINGLIKVQLKWNPFKQAFNKDLEKTAQQDLVSCRDFTEDSKGNIFVVGIDNLNEINDSLSVKVKFSNALLSAFHDKNDNIWVSFQRHIKRVDRETNEKSIFKYEGKIYKEWAWSLYEDKNGKIWAGTEYGLFYFEEGFARFQNSHIEGTPDLFKGTLTYHFFEDKEKQLWLATTNGLIKADLEKGVFEKYGKNVDKEHLLQANDFRHIHQDEQGVFWIASSEGLIRWDKEKSESRLFTTADGLSNNNIYAVYEDDAGFLWMSSDYGIMQFQKSTSIVKTYLPSDGVTHQEFNRISHHQSRKGMLYFGGLNGVTYFNPKDFAENFGGQIDVPLVLTEYHVFSEKSKQQEDRFSEYLATQKVTITPDDRYLTLQFGLLDYTNSYTPQYVYEIDGEQWKVSSENTLSISSLPYGNHTLTVKGKAANGLFSKNTCSIPIVVLKPFYLQWWFIGLSVTALAFGIFIYQKRKTQKLIEQKEILENTVQERTQTIQLQAEELHQLNKAKSKFMANISHEFRTPLTLVLNTLNSDRTKPKLNGNGQGKTFTYSEIDVNIMNRNAHRLQQLIEQLLDLSKMEAGKMTLQASQNDFYAYLKNLILSFQPMANNKNINLTFSSNLKDCILYFDRDKMDKIIYNLLGNAIKFTPKNKNVNILLKTKNNLAIFHIVDTGIGIPKKEIPFIFDRFYRGDLKDEFAYEGTGLGLALVKELVEMHHGKIEVESEVGKGTNFIIHFPLGNQHLQPEEIIFKDESLLTKPSKIGKIILEESSKLKPTEEKPILLIIEDNEDLLYHHQQNFKNDFQLLLAKDGQEGIDLATEHLPNLIVCDVMMPKKNGYEVCQHLKLDEKTNHIPIILLTAKAEQAEKMEGLLVGADDYLTKPYHQNELETRLKNLLVLQQNLQEKFKAQIKAPTPTSTVKTPQERFVQKCKSIVEENYANPEFGVEDWENQMYMSRAQFFRKIKTVLGMTPSQFIRSYRLEKAKELLKQDVWNGSEVAYKVGFKNPNYFFRCFKEEYGMTVGDFVKT